MAQKLITILSELASDTKAFNLDDRISFRYLYHKFNSKIQYFLRLEAKSREILKDYTLWKKIDCLELIDVASNSCGFIDGCNTLKRSKEKIPEAFNTNYGPIIKLLTIGVNGEELKLINSSAYSSYITREYNNKLPYWIENNYIYIPNTNIQILKVLIMPKNPIEVDILNGEATKCSKIFDSIVNYPDYLITLAKQEVIKELLNGYKRVIEDEKGDDNTNRKN